MQGKCTLDYGFHHDFAKVGTLEQISKICHFSCCFSWFQGTIWINCVSCLEMLHNFTFPMPTKLIAGAHTRFTERGPIDVFPFFPFFSPCVSFFWFLSLAIISQVSPSSFQVCGKCATKLLFATLVPNLIRIFNPCPKKKTSGTCSGRARDKHFQPSSRKCTHFNKKSLIIFY